MDAGLKAAGLEAAQAELTALLGEDWDRITEAMWRAFEEFGRQKDAGLVSEKTQFAYKIALGVTLVPRGGEMDVCATSAWGVKWKDVSTGQTANATMDLPLEDGD